MIILTNCLTQTPDEGIVKVSTSLIKRILKEKDGVRVISYSRKKVLDCEKISVNKLMLSPKLAKILYVSKDSVLYIPFPTRVLPCIWRILVLSTFSRHNLKVVMIMKMHMGRIAGALLKLSGAEVIALSKDSWSYYSGIIGENAKYLRMGVDIKRFIPVTETHKCDLRNKYNIPQNKTVVLHVGHLKEGREIRRLLDIDQDYFVLLVVSTRTAQEQDEKLRKQLEQRENLRIIDSYVADIEEIYQLSDVYFFPVQELGQCIDVPLSVLEAAACNIPVVHTPYQELCEFHGKEGFYEIDSFKPECINGLIEQALREQASPRKSILNYDWAIAVQQI